MTEPDRDGFEVTPELAHQAIRLASHKLNLSTFTHTEMLTNLRDVRQKRIEAAIRAS
ncbi:hypothetical protein ACFIOY_20155 [Bradyrhizobium sp. TZ2]